MKIAIALIAAVAIGFLFWRQSGVSDAVFESPSVKASKLGLVTSLANEQAQDVGASFDSISDVVGDPSAANGAAKSESDSDASNAERFFARLSAEFGTPETDYAAASARLKSEWDPRYTAAVAEHEKFVYRIQKVKEAGSEYFALQDALSKEISNPELRAEQIRRDAAEAELFREWNRQADARLVDIQKIMSDLKDMDIIIEKQNLSAHFTAIYDGFDELPASVTQLHLDLDRFHQQSELIAQTFAPQIN